MDTPRWATLAVTGALLLAGCDGGDATPTAPAGNEVPADENARDDPGQRDPGGKLEDPSPDEPPPDPADAD